MERTMIAVALAALAALLLALPAAGIASVDDGTQGQLADGDAADPANETAPGERFSGVVGVGEAELEGDVQMRAYGHQIANASTDEARADAVAVRLSHLEQRLAELEQRNETLHELREAGEITPGQYRAELARLEARTQMIRAMTNQSAAYADQVDPAVFEERMAHHGMMRGDIDTISERAHRLGGPMAAESARDIAGPRMGPMHSDDGSIGMPGPGGDRGPMGPDDDDHGPHWSDDDDSRHPDGNDSDDRRSGRP